MESGGAGVKSWVSIPKWYNKSTVGDPEAPLSQHEVSIKFVAGFWRRGCLKKLMRLIKVDEVDIHSLEKVAILLFLGCYYQPL